MGKTEFLGKAATGLLRNGWSVSWHPAIASRSTQHDRGRFPPITRRVRAASRTHVRPRRTMVGREGGLDASP